MAIQLSNLNFYIHEFGRISSLFPIGDLMDSECCFDASKKKNALLLCTSTKWRREKHICRYSAKGDSFKFSGHLRIIVD